MTKLSVRRVVYLKHHGRGRCKLCPEQLLEGETASLTVVHVPGKVFEINNVCHACVEALVAAWKNMVEAAQLSSQTFTELESED